MISVFKGAVLGITLIAGLLYGFSIYIYNGNCGLGLGLLGGNAHECTFTEYLTSKDGIVLVSGFILSSFWFVAIGILLMTILGMYFWDRRKGKSALK